MRLAGANLLVELTNRLLFILIIHNCQHTLLHCSSKALTNTTAISTTNTLVNETMLEPNRTLSISRGQSEGLKNTLSTDDSTNFDLSTPQEPQISFNVASLEPPVLPGADKQVDKINCNNETNVNIAYHTKPDSHNHNELSNSEVGISLVSVNANESLNDNLKQGGKRKVGIEFDSADGPAKFERNLMEDHQQEQQGLLGMGSSRYNTQITEVLNTTNERWSQQIEQEQRLIKEHQLKLKQTNSSTKPQSQKRRAKPLAPDIGNNNHFGKKQLINYLKLLNSMRLPEVTILPAMKPLMSSSLDARQFLKKSIQFPMEVPKRRRQPEDPIWQPIHHQHRPPLVMKRTIQRWSLQGPQRLPWDPMVVGPSNSVSNSLESTRKRIASRFYKILQQQHQPLYSQPEFPLESSINSFATHLNESPTIGAYEAMSAAGHGDVGDISSTNMDGGIKSLGDSSWHLSSSSDEPFSSAELAGNLSLSETDFEMSPLNEPSLQSLVESALNGSTENSNNKYIPLHSSTPPQPFARPSYHHSGLRYPGSAEEESEQTSYQALPPADWTNHALSPSMGPYGPYRPQKNKRSKGKRRYPGTFNGYPGNRGKGGNRRPSVKVQRRPRYPQQQQSPTPPLGSGMSDDGMVASPSKQQLHEIDSPNDLQPSSTLLRWKYPGLFRPYDYDDDEEEGETEVNIRFFNNFSRMGPLGGVARTAGTATVIVSLAFLIISNVSLAATVIAHGISALLKAASQNVSQSSNKPKQSQPVYSSGSRQSNSLINSRLEKSPLGAHLFRWRATTKSPTNTFTSTSTTTTSTTTTTTTSTSTTTTTRRPTTTSSFPSMTFDRQIIAFGDNWQ